MTFEGWEAYKTQSDSKAEELFRSVENPAGGGSYWDTGFTVSVVTEGNNLFEIAAIDAVLVTVQRQETTVAQVATGFDGIQQGIRRQRGIGDPRRAPDTGQNLGQRRQQIAGLELQEDPDAAWLGQPHCVVQRVRLGDRDRVVVDCQTRSPLEGQRSTAGPWRHHHRLTGIGQLTYHVTADIPGAPCNQNFVAHESFSSRCLSCA